MDIQTSHGKLSFSRYLSRVNYLREKCRGRKVLHLGCSSGRYIKDRLDRRSLLHALLHKESSELYGLDLDAASLAVMRDELGFKNLYSGNVENLDHAEINQAFDVVVAGDLLEHLTCPGAMLNGVKRLLNPDGQLVISTVNAFGLHFQLRRWLGNYVEHVEHVCFYSPETLVHLMERHGFRVLEMCGVYTEPPYTFKQKIKFAIGSPLFKMVPVLAGTLLVVATPIRG